MRGLNLKSFKKVGGDDDHSVMQHDDGHQIKILHKPLSSGMKKELMKLPVAKMADGGKPKPEPSGIPGGSGSPAIDKDKASQMEKGATQPGTSFTEGWNNIKKGLGFKDGGRVKYAEGSDEPVGQDPPITPESLAAMQASASNTGGALNLPAPVAPTITPDQAEAFQSGQAPPIATPAAPKSTSVQAPQGSAPIDQYAGAQNTYVNNLGQGIKEEVGGKYAEAAAIGAQGKAEAASLQSNQAMLHDIQQAGTTKMQEVQGEIDNVTKDIANQHIDPNHYLGSMDTVPRIATGIGLLLSGFGAGLSGKSNMAMEFLDKQIQRDVDAQKAELGKNENLVSAYQRQYGNIRDATQMAIATQGKLLENQLMQAASEAKDPIAKARALQAAGEVHQKYAAIPMQVAKNQALIQLTSGSAGSPQKGTQLLNILHVADPAAATELMKRALPDGKGGTEFSPNVEITPGDRDAFKEMNLMDANAKDLLGYLKHKSSWSIQDRQIAEEKALALQSGYRAGNLQTVYKAGEQPLLDKAVSENPLSFKSRILGTEPAKIQELIEANQRALRAHRQKLGLPTSAPIQFTPK